MPPSELELCERKAEPTPREALERQLRQGHFESDALELGEVLEIPKPKNPNQTMGSAPGEPWGVNQELIAVIKAGQDYYFLIDASARVKSYWTDCADNINGTFVAKFRPDTTSQVVNFSVERDFEDATIKQLSTRIRRPGIDVTIAQDEDGVVGIADEGSKEWIEVFRQNPEQPTLLELNGASAWYLRSSQIMDAIEGTLHSF